MVVLASACERLVVIITTDVMSSQPCTLVSTTLAIHPALHARMGPLGVTSSYHAGRPDPIPALSRAALVDGTASCTTCTF